MREPRSGKHEWRNGEKESFSFSPLRDSCSPPQAEKKSRKTSGTRVLGQKLTMRISYQTLFIIPYPFHSRVVFVAMNTLQKPSYSKLNHHSNERNINANSCVVYVFQSNNKSEQWDGNQLNSMTAVAWVMSEKTYQHKNASYWVITKDKTPWRFVVLEDMFQHNWAPFIDETTREINGMGEKTWKSMALTKREVQASSLLQKEKEMEGSLPLLMGNLHLHFVFKDFSVARS